MLGYPIIRQVFPYNVIAFEDAVVQQIALIETAMPSAILATIYAKHYDCKPELVSTTIVITLIFSLLSVTALFYIFF